MWVCVILFKKGLGTFASDAGEKEDTLITRSSLLPQNFVKGWVTADGAGSTQKSEHGLYRPMPPFKGYLHWEPAVTLGARSPY